MLAPIETKGPESRARKPIRPNLTGEMEFSRYRKKLVLANKLEEIERMRQALVLQKEALERESQLASQLGGSHSSLGGTEGGSHSLQKGGSGSLTHTSSQRLGSQSLSQLLTQPEPKKPMTRNEKRMMRHSVAPAMSAKLGFVAEPEGGHINASELLGGSTGPPQVLSLSLRCPHAVLILPYHSNYPVLTQYQPCPNPILIISYRCPYPL